MIAVVILLALLFLFMWSEGKPFYGEASGGSAHDPQFAEYISQCSRGIPQACDKIGEAAENVQIETVEPDYERDALRAQRIG